MNRIRFVLARTLYCQARCYTNLQPELVQSLSAESLTYLPADNFDELYATTRAHAKLMIAYALYDQGYHAEAELNAREVLADFQKYNDPVGMGYTMHSLALIVYTLGNYEQAQDWWEQSLAVLNSLGEQWLKADVLAFLSEVLCRLGKFAEGQIYAQEGYRIAQSFGLHTLSGDVSCMMGYVIYCLQQYDQAKLYFDACLINAEELDEDFPRFVAKHWLANIAYHQGDYHESKRIFREAHIIAMRMNRQNDVGIALTGLGNAECALAEYTTAYQHFQAAMTVFQKTRALPDIMDTLVGISRLWMKIEKLADAASLLTFTCRHPATGKETQMRAEELLEALQVTLNDLSFTNAQTTGTTLTLEAAIQASLQINFIPVG